MRIFSIITFAFLSLFVTMLFPACSNDDEEEQTGFHAYSISIDNLTEYDWFNTQVKYYNEKNELVKTVDGATVSRFFNVEVMCYGEFLIVEFNDVSGKKHLTQRYKTQKTLQIKLLQN